MPEIEIALRVNGRAAQWRVQPGETLLEALHAHHLKGTKLICGTGDCCGCGVILDGRSINACCTLAAQAADADLLTIEGLSQDGSLHPIQEAFAEAPKCTAKDVPDVKLALYDDTTRQIYILDSQDQAVGHLGDSMTLTGTLEGNTVHVTSLKMHTSIGLNVGEKAPDFSARDQFGRQQTLETLKGTKGTVLLFFRSADW